MRFSFAAALLGAALVLAPSASAQGAPSLLTSIGSPFPYRIDLPRDWEIHRDSRNTHGGTLHVLLASSGNRVAILVTGDVLKDQKESTFASEGQTRQILTDMLVNSDSLLYALMNKFRGDMAAGEGPMLDVVQEIRTLGGQRSAYMKGRTVIGRKSQWIELHATFQNGIMYVLMFIVETDDYAAHEPLFARIRDSLVLAPAPR